MSRERTASASSSIREELGISPLAISLSDAVDPFSTFSNAYARRIKAGSNEDFDDRNEEGNFQCGKNLSPNKRGSIVSLNKNGLGIGIIDISEFGPPNDTLPSIDNPYVRRVLAGSQEDFEDYVDDDKNNAYSDDDDDDNNNEKESREGRLKKDRGDSIAIKEDFIITKIEVKDLGGPAGDFLPSMDTKYNKRIKSGSQEDFGDVDNTDRPIYTPGKRFANKRGSIGGLSKDLLGISSLSVAELGGPVDAIPLKEHEGVIQIKEYENKGESDEDDEDLSDDKRDRVESVSILSNSQFILAKLDIKEIAGANDVLPFFETKSNQRIRGGSNEDFHTTRGEPTGERLSMQDASRTEIRLQSIDYQEEDDDDEFPLEVREKRERLESIKDFDKASHGIDSINLTAIGGGPIDPFSSMETPHNRRVKSGSQEEFEGEDGIFSPGKNIRKNKRGSIVSLDKAHLGIISLDVEACGPYGADSTPSIKPHTLEQ